MRILALSTLLTIGCAVAPKTNPVTPAQAPPPSQPQPAPPAEPAKPITQQELDDAYTRATRLLQARDFAGAARTFQDLIDRARALHEGVREAWLHNAQTWVRWAEHDQKAALAENEAVAQAVAPLPERDRREPLLHYWWDRAYLLKELPAEAASADAARKQYETLARLPDNADGVAVLEAFFAVVDRDGKRALLEARKVDAAKDDDLQDLYVLQLAHDAGGDEAGAEKIRALIRKGNEYPMKPVILQRMEWDRKK
jgi:hypothetical protein